MKITLKNLLCLMLSLTMVLSFLSIAFAGTSNNDVNIKSVDSSEELLQSDEVKVFNFTTAQVINAFEEVTGKDANTVLSKSEIKAASNSQKLYRAKASDKNKVVYSEKDNKTDIYLNKATVKLLVGAGSGSAAVGILTKVFASITVNPVVAAILTFLILYVVAEVLGNNLSGDKAIILHYKVVVVHRGEKKDIRTISQVGSINKLIIYENITVY